MDLFIKTGISELIASEGLFKVVKPDSSHTFHPEKISRIWIDKNINLNGEVIHLALEKNLSIIFYDENGLPIGCLHPYFKTKGLSLVEKQWRLSLQPEASGLVSAYVFSGQQRRLQLLIDLAISDSHTSVNKMKQIIDRNRAFFDMEELGAPPVSELQEALFAKKYYDALNSLLPPAFQFDTRSRRPARDPFNALLNYSLGWLYAILQDALMKAKLDPYIGFNHQPKDGAPALVFDLIEAYRAWVEEATVALILENRISLDEFEYRENNAGIKILKTSRRKIIEFVHQTFQKTNGTDSRFDTIFKDARNLARLIKQT